MSIYMETLSVEPMQWEDIDKVSAIERRSYNTPWHQNAYETELTNRCACYLVARSGSEILGYVGMWVIMDEAHITTIAVDPSHRGRKIGELLLVSLLETAVERGATRATLEVRERNTIAQNLYRKYDFRDAALRKSYYSDNHENAIVMWAEQINAEDYVERLLNQKEVLTKSANDSIGNRDKL